MLHQLLQCLLQQKLLYMRSQQNKPQPMLQVDTDIHMAQADTLTN
jgi:hypothetical protein